MTCYREKDIISYAHIIWSPRGKWQETLCGIVCTHGKGHHMESYTQMGRDIKWSPIYKWEGTSCGVLCINGRDIIWSPIYKWEGISCGVL